MALFAFALVPAGAAAADPTDAQYGSSLSQVTQGGAGGGGAGGDLGSASSSAAGGLPFTGLDVALLAVVAAGLLLAGLLIRRHRPSESSKA